MDKLRAACDDCVSFVAVDNDTVVGRIFFPPAALDNGGLSGMGLVPMAVWPSYQEQGVGTRLIRHGLDHVRQAGCVFVSVSGYPEYYPRFGFEPASNHTLKVASTFNGMVFPMRPSW